MVNAKRVAQTQILDMLQTRQSDLSLKSNSVRKKEIKRKRAKESDSDPGGTRTHNLGKWCLLLEAGLCI